MIKIFKYIMLLLIGLAIIFIAYFFIGFAYPAKNISWGVNFSVKQTDFLKIDSREAYLAVLDDLKAKNVKISVYWDLIEKEKGKYDFDELDWQIKEAEKRNVKVILAIGMKVPRWPECHLPQWVRDIDKYGQQQEIIDMLRTIVSRYKDSSSLAAWQVENEALLNFGACPWHDEDFLRREIAFVKINDTNHPIIATDSGELSFWFRSSLSGADIVGVTTYKKIWQQHVHMYLSYILPPVFYHRRAELVKGLFNKDVIGTELQAEPWCANSIMNSSLKEQAKTMDLKQFKKNVEFAKSTGIDTFYFWGAEWWYYMKKVNNDSEIWDEARKILQ
ncbi:MAG: beta-galactosidase [Candidatus Paceibacterota bacterium]